MPDLALKRGLGRDLVIAPYASALAAMVAPRRRLANLARWRSSARSALTASASRWTTPDPIRGMRFAVVRTYMAHHVGMSLVALANVLTGQRWQRRFHADPMVRSAELLLHERIPRRAGAAGAAGARADEALPDPERGAARGPRGGHPRHAAARTSPCSANCPTPSW